MSAVTNRLLTSEYGLVWRGRRSQPATDRLIVVTHGRTVAAAANESQFQWLPLSTGAPPIVAYLAERGYALLAIEAGGNTTWGNDLSQTRVGEAITWARAQGICHPTAKVGLLAYSMGGATVFNYAKNNSSTVAAVVGLAPAIDLAAQTATFGAEMDTAYGGSWATNGAGHDPLTYAASFTLPTRIYSAVDDPTVLIASVRSFNTALGSATKSLIELASGGHTSFFGLIDQQELLGWLGDRSW